MKKLLAFLNTPLGVVIVVGMVALIVELLFMTLLHGFLEVRFKLSDTAWNVIDAITLTVTISPALYFLVFRKIHESEQRFRQTLATAPNAIVIVGGEGRITDWNLAAQRMFGYSEEEAVGQLMHQLLPPHRYRDDAERGFAHFQETGKGPVIGKVTEIAALRKDGSEFPIELSISAVKLKGRWHAIGIIHDITERKRAADILHTSEERFHHLFENMSSAVAVYQPDAACEVFTFKSVNRALERIERVKREEVLDRSIEGAFPGVRAFGLLEVLRRVCRSGEAEHFPLAFYQDERISGWRENYIYRLDSGEIVAVYDDVTGRKQAEQKKLEAGILLKDSLEGAIGAIAATLEQRDPYTAGHQRRVAQLAAAIGEEMGLAREVIEGIHFGGLIHDLGKISVPAEILGKPGRLTGIEFGLIKTHAEAGYQIVKEIAFPWPVADMVYQHHERLDGSGYPQGLKGEQIVLEARILAVADVVEAMSSNRPYRPGFGMDAALGEITRVRGAQLDPVAVDACLRVVREKGFVFTK
ncbi:MAG: PAS domain S-box protein [Nitrosomonadales bacterium]|nr:PAS domain S-box protein [Nitrosomonadales bacterium]